MKVSLTNFLWLLLQINAVHCFWRMICDSPIVTARIDPIVAPGEIADHVHAITGPSTISCNSSYDDLRAAECTTCQVTQDHSAYWVPQLYYVHENGTYESVDMVTGITAYYLQRGTAGPAGKILAVPNGLRMLAGDPNRRSFNDSDVAQRAISFSCLGGNGGQNSLDTITNCPDGLRAEIFFPNCWDGVNLDSKDHRSHMAYSGDDGDGTCPSSHPVKLVSIFYEAMFGIDYWSNSWWNGTAAPFVFANGDPTGYGLHADFMSGWDENFLQTAVDTCNNDSGLIQDCAVFDIDYDAAGSCTWAGTLLTSENVLGTHGGLPALPGCNPINWGPEEVVTPTCSGSSVSDNTVQSSASPCSSSSKPLSTSSSSSTTAAASSSSSISSASTAVSSSSTTPQSSLSSPIVVVQLNASPAVTSASTNAAGPADTLSSLSSSAPPVTTSSSSSVAAAIVASNSLGNVVYVTVDEIEYITITSTIAIPDSTYVQLYVIPKSVGQALAAQQLASTVTSTVTGPITSTVSAQSASTNMYASMAANQALPQMGTVVNVTDPGTLYTTLQTAVVPTTEVQIVTRYVTTTITV